MSIVDIEALCNSKSIESTAFVHYSFSFTASLLLSLLLRFFVFLRDSLCSLRSFSKRCWCCCRFFFRVFVFCNFVIIHWTINLAFGVTAAIGAYYAPLSSLRHFEHTLRPSNVKHWHLTEYRPNSRCAGFVLSNWIKLDHWTLWNLKLAREPDQANWGGLNNQLMICRRTVDIR